VGSGLAIFDGFNRSIWDALWIISPVSFVVYLAMFFSITKKDHYYLFDPKHIPGNSFKDRGDFEPHARRYQDLAKLVITLSAAAIAFLINVLVTKQPATGMISKIEWSAPIVVGFFGFAIASLIGFLLSQTIWYEEYCHSAEHKSYVRWKYAASQCLGWSGLLAFILGFGWLARNIFST
jgi:hypothetical protein